MRPIHVDEMFRCFAVPGYHRFWNLIIGKTFTATGPNDVRVVTSEGIAQLYCDDPSKP